MFVLLVLLLVHMASALCDNGSGDVGTLVRAGDTCADAFPSFGFNASFFDFSFFSTSAGTTVRANSTMRSEVRSTGVGGTGLSVLNGHGFVKPCLCVSGVCPVSRPLSPVAMCTGNNAYLVNALGNTQLCLSFGAALPAAADGATPSAMFALSGSQLKVKVNNGPEVTYGAGAVKTASGGAQLVAVALINGAGLGVFFSACGPLIVQNGSSLSSYPTSIGTGRLMTRAVCSRLSDVSRASVGTLLLRDARLSCENAFPSFGFSGAVVNSIVLRGGETSGELAIAQSSLLPVPMPVGEIRVRVSYRS
jgi:hypothetical protein